MRNRSSGRPMGDRTNHFDTFWITGFVASCGDRDGRGVAGHGGTDRASAFQHTREHVYAPVLVPACTPPLPRRPSQRPPRSWCVQRPTRPDASLYLLSRLHAEPEITTSLDTLRGGGQPVWDAYPGVSRATFAMEALRTPLTRVRLLFLSFLPGGPPRPSLCEQVPRCDPRRRAEERLRCRC